MRRLFRGMGRTGRRVLLALVAVASVASGVSAVALVALVTAPPAKASSSVPNATLLMIHGFDDTCHDAFQRKQDSPGAMPGPNDVTTYDYFTQAQQGWSGQIRLVGFYNSAVKDESACDINLSSESADLGGSICDASPLISSVTLKGTRDDPIRHLGCKLAWYIYNLNVNSSSPVFVLAHSMGGLIIRDALAESGVNASFPPALDVRQVVTVGTPHGGLRGWYLRSAKASYNPLPLQILDMDAEGDGSGFMGMLTSDQFQAPRGGHGAYWTLIAASVSGHSNIPCLPATGTSTYSCAAETLHQNDPYPDGDGVVQADSALSMRADRKVLYGVASECQALSGCVEHTPGQSVDYSHEANTCTLVPVLIPTAPIQYANVNVCLAPDFLLNDGTSKSQQTQAWVCTSGCISGAIGTNGIADLHVGDLIGQNVMSYPHSLAAMASDLPPPMLISDVCYKALVMGNSTWQQEVCNGGVAGTVGQSLALQQIAVRLPSGAAFGAHICYSTHVQNIGWESESCDGNPAGDLNLQGLRIEAVKIHLNYAPGGAQVCYQAQVQNIGWQDTVCNGAQAGTTGQSLRMEALRVSVSWPAMNPPWLVSDVVSGGAFNTAWQQFGAASNLGNPTGAWYELNGGQGQDFNGTGCGGSGSTILWSSGTSTHEVQGCIYQEYKSLGGPKGVLGFPKSDERPVYASDGTTAIGRANDFAGGMCGNSGGGHIYYSGASGAHEVHGCIADYYLGHMNGPAGGLGFPLTDEQPVYASDGTTVIGRSNGFQGSSCGTSSWGRIWFPNATGLVHETNGCIGQKFEQGLGGPGGFLGFPTKDEYDVAGGRGQDYAGGMCGSSGGGHIYIGGGQSAHEVHGCIANVYLNNGGPGGWLGFPTSDEYAYSRGRESDFQYGYILYDSTNGTTTAYSYNSGPCVPKQPC